MEHQNITSPPPPLLLQVTGSREYGASTALISIARKIGLDRLIFSRPKRWREDALAMIVAKLVFPLGEIASLRSYMDTVLWEKCGLPQYTKPTIEKDCYLPLTHLLSQKDSIEKRLTKRHLKEKRAILYDVTGWGNPFCQVHAGLLTNAEGCPLGIEFFSSDSFLEIGNHINKILDRNRLHSLQVVSNYEFEIDHILKGKREIDQNQKASVGSFEAINFFANLAPDLPNEDLIRAHLVVGLLAYYLKWQATKLLNKAFEEGKIPEKWTFDIVIERLKSIRSQSIQIEGVILENLVNQLDGEQLKMISALGIDAI